MWLGCVRIHHDPIVKRHRPCVAPEFARLRRERIQICATNSQCAWQSDHVLERSSFERRQGQGLLPRFQTPSIPSEASQFAVPLYKEGTSETLASRRYG